MIVALGEKLHIITRRRFDGDLRRHFVGEVKAIHEGIARVEGFAFIFDIVKTIFVRKPEKRTSIFQLADSGYIVHVIPKEVNIEELTYLRSTQLNMVITDNKSFRLDINEFAFNR